MYRVWPQVIENDVPFAHEFVGGIGVGPLWVGMTLAGMGELEEI
jgi:hypothetical protein